MTNPNPAYQGNAYDQKPVAHHSEGHTRVRVLGVFILLVELGLLFAYGFAGYIINEYGAWGGAAGIGTLFPY